MALSSQQMNTHTPHRLALAIAGALMLGVSFAPIAHAQDAAPPPDDGTARESGAEARGAEAPGAETSGTQAPGTQAPDTDDLDTITVVGIRSSLQKAADIKRAAPQVVDVITAEDVGKLPDENVAEALQRVTGVQVTRVFGEGQSVSIRGLQQVRVEVDSRTLLGWSARLSPPENEQLGRNSGLDTVPSGLFGRIEVRKSPTASQIEGGLGGVVNLVTPDPFDFREPLLQGRVQASHSDASGQTEPALSLFYARTFADGRFGVIGAVDYQERTRLIQAFERNDFFNLGSSDLNGDGRVDVSGDRLHYEQFETDRTRGGAQLEAQFKVNDTLTLKTEWIVSKMKTEREQAFLAWRYAGRAVTSPTFDGNTIVAGRSTGSIQQAALFRAEPTKSWLGSISANWRQGGWTVDLDLSRSRGTLEQTIRQVTLNSLATTIVGDFNYTNGPVPTLDLGAFDPTDIANYRASEVRANFLKGELDERVARVDARYDFEGGVLRSLSFGVRARGLDARSNAYRTIAVPTATELAGFLRTTGGGFLSDLPGDLPRNFVVVDAPPRWVLDRVGGFPLQPNAARDYDLRETSDAVYLMADFDGELGGLGYRANAGVRYVRTDLDVDTFLQTSGQAALRPINSRNRYDNLLPSANFALNLTDDLLLRLAASRTLQQAGIAELAPFIFVNPTNRTASGGNAELSPIIADQADLSLEWYANQDTLLSGAVFYKRIEDFIADETVLQTFPGFEALGPIPFTRPANQGSARVKGIELGIQTFFDWLPAPFDGFGIIANYTLSDAEDDRGNPLVGVSRNSYNLIAIYEKGPFSSRLAFNARDEAAFSFTQGRVNYVGERSQLDLQMGWKLGDRFGLQFQASNLLPKNSATIEYADIGEVALNSYALSDTTYSLSFRAKF